MSMKRLIPVALLAAVAFAVPAHAQEQKPLKKIDWSFEGPFGTYDRAALQRGFQVYKEICSTCHAMKHLTYRDLGPAGPNGGIGLSEAEVRALASQYQITDGPNDQGEMFERPGRPSDPFKSPFPNDQAARAANNNALPKDLSIIVKAREGGSDYIHSLLTGFVQAPEGTKVPNGLYYNEYFPGHFIAMPPPLSQGAVNYADGTPSSVDQMAQDVTTFLTWASHPEMEERKGLGLKVMAFLVLFTGLMFAAKRKIWRDVH
jgi:ubiquinol-cytochrome c reductase cytochrome c1 subunit